MVVPAGMGPTMRACTASPAVTVTKDACEGTSPGSVTACWPAGSPASRSTWEVLRGSGGVKDVAHHATTCTSADLSRCRSTVRV
jgi:hypothetical protein